MFIATSSMLTERLPSSSRATFLLQTPHLRKQNKAKNTDHQNLTWGCSLSHRTALHVQNGIPLSTGTGYTHRETALFYIKSSIVSPLYI